MVIERYLPDQSRNLCVIFQTFNNYHAKASYFRLYNNVVVIVFPIEMWLLSRNNCVFLRIPSSLEITANSNSNRTAYYRPGSNGSYYIYCFIVHRSYVTCADRVQRFRKLCAHALTNRVRVFIVKFYGSTKKTASMA